MANEYLRETLTEYASTSAATVDREASVIRGVKILGHVSTNGRTYTQECVTAAVPLYEGARVNVNHSQKQRNYEDRIGVLRGIHSEDDGLYGDLHYNPKHAVAEQLAWDAENAPNNVGLSHCAEARTSRKDGKTVVEEIKRVISVDVVADPASTGGLFEGTEVPDAQREFCEHALSAISDARSIILGEAEEDIKRTRLLEVLATWQAELGDRTSKQDSDMDWKDVTIEGLRENRTDIVERLTGTDEVTKLTGDLETTRKELAEATDNLGKAEAKLTEAAEAEAVRARDAKIEEELREAKLDPADKKIVSEAFIASLKTADDAQRKALIEDRAALLSTRRAPASSSAPPMGSVGGVGAETKKDLLARL